MSNLKRIKPEKEVHNGWTRWVQPVRRNYKLACCDCGLVHMFDFRISGDRVQFRAKRAPRYTLVERKKLRAKGRIK